MPDYTDLIPYQLIAVYKKNKFSTTSPGELLFDQNNGVSMDITGLDDNKKYDISEITPQVENTDPIKLPEVTAMYIYPI